jgi:hypothetical protein
MNKFHFLNHLKALSLVFASLLIAYSGIAQTPVFLKTGEKLNIDPSNELKKSLNGNYSFDPSLIFYDGQNPVWKPEIDRSNLDYLVLENTCNLLLYDKGGNVVWRSASHTYKFTDPCELRIENEGTLRIIVGYRCIWTLKDPSTGKYASPTGYYVPPPDLSPQGRGTNLNDF